MQAAAEDTPLARLWLERQQTTTTFETAMDFAAMGEQRAAAETLQALAARQVRGFAADRRRSGLSAAPAPSGLERMGRPSPAAAPAPRRRSRR